MRRLRKSISLAQMPTITTIEVRRRLQPFVKEHEGADDEAERVAFFFGMYEALTNLPVIPKKKTRKHS